MHPIASAKHWGHDLHSGMSTIRHHAYQHLHRRHFWAGVGVTLLILGILALIVMLALHAPIESTGGYPYGPPYFPHGR